ncbi:MAG: ATPase domain-containing protein [Candidatus Geothermarchaeales archaeon]
MGEIEAGDIPRELYEFFEIGGNILLIRGEPGTGKTILSLELLRRFGGERNGVYLTTRVSSDRLLNQFPWLRDVVMPEHVLGATDTSGGEGSFRVSDSTIREFPTVLEHFYELAIGIENPFIVVDSWYAIADELEPEQIRTTMKILETLVTSKSASIVLVSETTKQTSLDYMVDGVVTLYRGRVENRLCREVELNKLRGMSTTKDRYVFTLKDGRFRCFPLFAPKPPWEPKRWEPIPDTETHFSSGSEDLDKLLGGGFRRGSSNLLEIGEGVPRARGTIGFSVIFNIVAQGKGMFSLPTLGFSVEDYRSLMVPYVGEDQFKKHCRIVEFMEKVSNETKPYTIGFGGEDANKDLAYGLREVEKEIGFPAFVFVGLDTLEYVYGAKDGMKALTKITIETKRQRGFNLIMAFPGLGLTEEAASTADVHLKIVEIDGSIFLYGVKPWTGLYNLDRDVSRGFPRAKLTPIV